jgi:hypothetical protein
MWWWCRTTIRKALFESWSGDTQSIFRTSETTCRTSAGDFPLTGRLPPGVEVRSPDGIKKRLSQGAVAETRGGFAGHAAPANVLLKRRHAASDNKTDIPVPIFPISGFCSKKVRQPLLPCMSRVACRAVFAKLAACRLLLNSRRSTRQRIFCLTQTFQYGMNENLKNWNKRFSRQVFSLATRSGFRANAREKTCIVIVLSSAILTQTR